MAPVLKFQDVARVHDLYSDLERNEGWKDYTGRLKVMRDELVEELLRGSVDKFGRTRDDEKRAVLTYLERMLTFPRIVKEQYIMLKKKQEEMEDRASVSGNVHGSDFFAGGRVS